MKRRGPWRSQIWDELRRKKYVKDVPARSMFTFESGGTHGVLIKDGTAGREPMDVTPQQGFQVAMGLLSGWKVSNEF